MEKSFWQEKWQANEIGFHQPTPHPLLEKYASLIQAGERAHVFVPLCGKSVDMLRLGRDGVRVTGLELSHIAAKAFFTENQIAMEIASEGEFERFRSDGIEILCGDFFAVSAEQLGNVTAVYDRAALIALPPAMRGKYVRKLCSLLSGGEQIFLIAIEYKEGLVNAPPFSVSDAEIHSLYQDWGHIELLETRVAEVKAQPCVERLFKIEVNR